MRKCEMCGTSGKLIKHHILYHPEYLQLLCHKCHGLTHRDGKKRPDLTILTVEVKGKLRTLCDLLKIKHNGFIRIGVPTLQKFGINSVVVRLDK